MMAVPRNRYAINPLPPMPQRPGWFQRHGREVVTAAAVVGGVAAIGTVAYVIISALTGGQQPPACQALQNQLGQLQRQQMAIYAQAAHQGGTFTASQQAAIQSLAQQISNVIAQIAQVCVASPGATLQQTVDQIIIYGLWAAAGAVGLIAGAFTVAWFIRRWGQSKTKPGSPPSSPDDVEPSSEFNAAAAGTDAASGKVAGDYETGAIGAQQATDSLNAIAANDPAFSISSTIASFFRSVAARVSQAVATALDALANLWDAIVSAVDNAVLEISLALGLR